MFLFMFAGMEFSRANMIRNVIENAAFEGARQGVVPGADAADCAPPPSNNLISYASTTIPLPSIHS